MDTQGTFDHQSTVKDCTTIFALSTLLSSIQIFNVNSQIQEDDLNNLRLFTEFANLVKGRSRENQAPFQKLLFLVRDWPNSEENSYGYEGGQEYLSTLLKVIDFLVKEIQISDFPKAERRAPITSGKPQELLRILEGFPYATSGSPHC